MRKSVNLLNLLKKKTYICPAKDAVFLEVTVDSGGLHMMMTSWSDIMTTPGNFGNHTRALMNP
jgi:hypothetical protein